MLYVKFFPPSLLLGTVLRSTLLKGTFETETEGWVTPETTYGYSVLVGCDTKYISGGGRLSVEDLIRLTSGTRGSPVCPVVLILHLDGHRIVWRDLDGGGVVDR